MVIFFFCSGSSQLMVVSHCLCVALVGAADPLRGVSNDLFASLRGSCGAAASRFVCF